jgi:hypothetical protein
VLSSPYGATHQTIFATTAQRTDARIVRARLSTSRRYIPAGEHAIIPRSPMSDRQISPRMSAAHTYHCDARPPKHRRVYGLINTRLLQSLEIRLPCRLSPLESAHRLLVDRCSAVAAVIPCIRVSVYPCIRQQWLCKELPFSHEQIAPSYLATGGATKQGHTEELAMLLQPCCP